VVLQFNRRNAIGSVYFLLINLSVTVTEEIQMLIMFRSVPVAEESFLLKKTTGTLTGVEFTPDN